MWMHTSAGALGCGEDQASTGFMHWLGEERPKFRLNSLAEEPIGWVCEAKGAGSSGEPVKSGPFRVDGSPMTLFVAHILGTVEGWLAIGLIGGWLVLMCLRALASESEFAIRRHKLTVEARTLRLRQQERLKNLGVGVKR